MIRFIQSSTEKYWSDIATPSCDEGTRCITTDDIVVTPTGKIFHNKKQLSGFVAGRDSTSTFKVIPTQPFGEYEECFSIEGFDETSEKLTFYCLELGYASLGDYEFPFVKLKDNTTMPVVIDILFYDNDTGNPQTTSFDKYRFVVTEVERDSLDMGDYYLHKVTVTDDVNETTVQDCYNRMLSEDEHFFIIASGGLIGLSSQECLPSTLCQVLSECFPQIAIGSAVQCGFGGIALGSSCGGAGYFGIAAGRYSASLNDYSVAHGYRVHSAGPASFATGAYHQVTGKYSQAFGSSNIVSGEHSVAFNYGNNVTGTRSAAFGLNNTVRANAAFACGSNLTVVRDKSFVIGEYNQTSSAARFIIGGGTAQTPKNLIDVNDNYANFRVQIAAEKLITCKAGLTVRSDTGTDTARFQVPIELMSHIIIGASSYGYVNDPIPDLQDGQLYFVIEEN